MRLVEPGSSKFICNIDFELGAAFLTHLLHTKCGNKAVYVKKCNNRMKFNVTIKFTTFDGNLML